MRNPKMALWMVAAALLATVPATAQYEGPEGQGEAVVTVLPKHDGPVPASVANRDLSVKVDGKNAKVTKWAPFQSPANAVELVLLIDDGSRTSLGRQMGDIEQFVKSLPPNAKAGIAYMQNGRASFAGPLSADHAQVLKALHLPIGGAGVSASPYFCLSDLAKNWPSKDAAARREVVMVTDGVDNYNRAFDPDDPYVQTAIHDAVRARLVVYSIYWMSQGRGDTMGGGNVTGQNLLSLVADATGGKTFWQGSGNPVSFQPYFDDLTRRLNNQYELGFTTGLKGKAEVETLKLKLSAPGTEVDTPQQVLVAPKGARQ
jgi:hypothetical protein